MRWTTIDILLGSALFTAYGNAANLFVADPSGNLTRPAYLDMIYRYQLCYLDISILIYIDIDITLCLLTGYPD
jgi:hypothetical protein